VPCQFYCNRTPISLALALKGPILSLSSSVEQGCQLVLQRIHRTIVLESQNQDATPPMFLTAVDISRAGNQHKLSFIGMFKVAQGGSNYVT
jgi:hypothetical protein